MARAKHLHCMPGLAARRRDAATVQRVGSSARREVCGRGDGGPHGLSQPWRAAWLRRCAENFLIRLRRLGIVGLIRLRQRLAPYASNRSSDLVGRRFCLCRLVLDYLHRMTLRRIHAKQCRAALGDLEQKQPTPDVAILEGLGVKCLSRNCRVVAPELEGSPLAGFAVAVGGSSASSGTSPGAPYRAPKNDRARFEKKTTDFYMNSVDMENVRKYMAIIHQ